MSGGWNAKEAIRARLCESRIQRERKRVVRPRKKYAARLRDHRLGKRMEIKRGRRDLRQIAKRDTDADAALWARRDKELDDKVKVRMVKDRVKRASAYELDAKLTPNWDENHDALAPLMPAPRFDVTKRSAEQPWLGRDTRQDWIMYCSWRQSIDEWQHWQEYLNPTRELVVASAVSILERVLIVDVAKLVGTYLIPLSPHQLGFGYVAPVTPPSNCRHFIDSSPDFKQMYLETIVVAERSLRHLGEFGWTMWERVRKVADPRPVEAGILVFLLSQRPVVPTVGSLCSTEAIAELVSDWVRPLPEWNVSLESV